MIHCHGPSAAEPVGGAVLDVDGQCWSSSILVKKIESPELHLLHHVIDRYNRYDRYGIYDI